MEGGGLYVLDLHLRRRRIALARRATTDRDSGGVRRCTSRICHKVEQRHLRRCAVFKYCINWRIDICREINDLRRIVWAHCLGHDECRVVDRPNGPLAEKGLIGRWGREGIVV